MSPRHPRFAVPEPSKISCRSRAWSTTLPALWALAALLVLGGCSQSSPAPVAPPPTAPPEQTAADAALPELDRQVIQGHLDNGLTYYVRANPKPEARAELRLVVDAGSVLEAEDERGLAHFVEHMAFNGTERFERQELVSFVESLGMRFGADLNATTSFDETVYALTVPTDSQETLDTALEVLQQWAQGIRFDPQEVDKEKGVVLEEWRSGLGVASRLRDEQLPLLFRDSLYAERLPIGDPESIRAASPDKLRGFYRRWYRPELMAVVAVGDFDAQEMVQKIRRRFDQPWGPENPPPRPVVAVPDPGETLVSAVTDPELTSTQVAVYTRRPPLHMATRQDYRRELAELLRHSLLGQRLTEITRQPEPPFIWAQSTTLELVRGQRVEAQLVGVREGEVESGLEALLVEIERARRHGFTATELERVTKDLLRLYEQAYEERDRRSSVSLIGGYVDHFLTGDPHPGVEAELELVRSLLPTITLEELRLAGLDPADVSGDEKPGRVILVSGPGSEEALATAPGLPGRDELLAVFQRVQQRSIEPYIDTASDRPLLANLPTGGAATSRKPYRS